MVILHKVRYDILLNTIEVHLALQFLLSLFLSYGLYHFVRIVKLSSKMRKVAQEQREANSQRIELLVFILMVILVFFALFYTSPFRRYYPTYLEYTVYFYNSLLELILLISIIGTDNHTSKKFVKTKQLFAGVGALIGLILFYVYYQLMA
jgi:hypothetical protein